MMREDAVVGVTSNPTIFQKAISQGDDYDEQIKELLEQETDPKEIFLQLSARDVEAALDLLAPVHEKTGYDGFVSWEVDPTLAYDREGTFDEAMRLHRVDSTSPNLYVKIPATKPGLGAIEDCVAHGKNINVTLIFSLQRYAEVVEAYLRGLERLVAGGGEPERRALGRELLRLARRHRGGQAPRRDRLEGRARAARQARDREREARVRALSRRRSPGRAGSSSPARARTRSAACGLRRRRRTRRTATSSTSRS